MVFAVSLGSQHVVLSLLPNLFRSAPSARSSSPSALETQVNNKQQDEGPLFGESVIDFYLDGCLCFPPYSNNVIQLRRT